MKALKITLIIMGVLAAIFFIGSLFLPKTYNVSRSIVINAPESTVYNNIANFNYFLKWNPWYKMEPTAKVDISGPAAQPGHLYKWEGKDTGTGEMLIKSTEPFKTVDIDLKFIKPFESNATTKFQLDPVENGTKVTWKMSGENKSMIQKWMGLTMDNMIGKDFESGLQSLKQLSEKQ